MGNPSSVQSVPGHQLNDVDLSISDPLSSLQSNPHSDLLGRRHLGRNVLFGLHDCICSYSLPIKLHFGQAGTESRSNIKLDLNRRYLNHGRRLGPDGSSGQFWASFKESFSNKSFLYLLLAFSMVQGALNSLATLIDLISRPYGFSSFDNSVFGGLLILCGLIGAGVVSTIVTVTHKYKVTFIVISLFTLATFIGFIFTLNFRSMVISSIAVGLVGLTLTPTLPISYEYGIELTYPVGEAMTGGILNSGGQIIGIAEVGLAYLLANSPVTICLICAAGIAIGAVAVIFTKEDLRRTGIDKNQDRMISLKVPY